jgi:hypothetical protein
LNRLAQQVESLLAGVVGDFVAKATMKRNCELIGVTPDNLTAAQLPELAAKIERSASFFSGDAVGSDISEKIKKLSV